MIEKQNNAGSRDRFSMVFGRDIEAAFLFSRWRYVYVAVSPHISECDSWYVLYNNYICEKIIEAEDWSIGLYFNLN